MFSRIARFKGRSGWTMLGIVLGLVVAPVSALAAFTDVRVVGPFGTPPAAVTAANQLRVAEIDPANVRVFRVVAQLNGCYVVNAPAGSSLLLKQVTVAYSDTSPINGNDIVNIFKKNECYRDWNVATILASSMNDTVVNPFEPGIPIKSGEGFAVGNFGDGTALVTVLAYVMPPNAVPTNIPVPAVTTPQPPAAGK